MAARPTTPVARHTVVVRLHDRPGALYRAIGLIRRRDYNVSSLVVGPSETPGISHMALVVEATDVRQIVQQLSRLIDVLSVHEVARSEHAGAPTIPGMPAMPNVPTMPDLPPATPAQELAR
jgi:acetolactate synthase small subunit